MIHSNYSFKAISAGVLLSFYCAVPVLAEDIEIYNTLGGNVGEIKPNVLFVVDTSGSMSNNSITISEDYNPATTYADADADCGSNRIYWNRSGSPPSCNSEDYFNSSALNCDHALHKYDASDVVVVGADGPLEAQGFYADNMAQKRGSTWDSIRTNNSSRRNLAIECETDQGIHGSVASPTPNTYIEHSDTAWGNTESISTWPGRFYTIYTSNYMNYLANPSTSRTITRFQAVKEAMATIVETSNDINIGLMGFNGWGGAWWTSGSPNYDGGQVRFAMENIDTARQPFIDFVLDPGFNTNSWTPLSETYYEAIHYFGGKTPPYGTSPYSSPSSVLASLEGDGTYLSPITNECQNNYIVFLTDGDPTLDTLSVSRLSALSGYTDFTCASTNETTSEGNQAIIEGNCLDRLSGWANNHDVSDELAGKQTIVTNTIGFGSGLSQFAVAMLQRTAANGGGSYYEAQNPTDLINAFTQSIASAQQDNTTFSSPAVSVNAFNRSVNLDDLYFTLFQPAVSPHWPGNFKKYKLGFDVDPDDATKRIPVIVDGTGANAIDAGGFFSSASQSFWSNSADGAEVPEGGAAGEFDFRTDPIPALRNVYTYTGGYSNNNGVFSPSLSSGSLTINDNRVVQSNLSITEAMLDIVGKPPTSQIPGSTPLIETLLDWASGLDAIGTPGTTDVLRTEMGDPLHSQPALIPYGTTEANPELVAYVATNDGYLHAINTDDGSELFSFIPQELLPNLDVLMENISSDKIYGLDGDVVSWFNDINKDGIINGADTVYLYIGMRRGGKNIYSVDVTSRTNPRLRWVIKGETGDYAELGQTWSSVNVEKVKDAASPNGSKTVLIFGGGYDASQDNATVRTADNEGRAVYIVDAITGSRLWSAGPGGNLPLAEMDYSIPARIKPLDLSGDGNVDRLYVADTGGQIFRFDLDETQTNFTPANISGGRIADLAVDSSLADARRFYYPPDVALIANKGKPAYLALSIASGYRAHPNDIRGHDRIYLLKDSDIYNTPNSYVTLTEADLYNATQNMAGGEGLNGDGTDAGQEAALSSLDNTKGWYIFLDDESAVGNWVGEKGLSETLILEGTVIVTTYVPFDPGATVTPTNVCTANAAGTGKIFFMDVSDATPVLSAATDKRPGRHLYSLGKSGIPPTPRVIITKGGEPTLCVGTECMAAGVVTGVRRTFWYEEE